MKSRTKSFIILVPFKILFTQLYCFSFSFYEFFFFEFFFYSLAFEKQHFIQHVQHLTNIQCTSSMAQNTSWSIANKTSCPMKQKPPTLIPKTIPKLQNSLRIWWYHGFSLKACSELQNKERETRLKRAIKGINSR